MQPDETHISGQYDSRQVHNHLHNGSSLPSHMQTLDTNNTWNMDPEVQMAHTYTQQTIYQDLQTRASTPDLQPMMKDISIRLEGLLCRNATSKEEYMNMNTLEQRLHAVIRQLLGSNHGQQLPSHPSSSSSTTGTKISTPGMMHSGNLNSSITSSMANLTIASTDCINKQQMIVDMEQWLPTTSSGSVGAVHGVGSFNASNGPLPNALEQSPAGISFGSGGTNIMGQRLENQMIPTPGLSNARSSMSGQIYPGQVHNHQVANQLPGGLPPHGGSSLPSHMQTLHALRSTWNMDPDEFQMVRAFIQEKVYYLLHKNPPCTPEMWPMMKDISIRLEALLYKNATSKEEYMNIGTLEQRLWSLIRQLPGSNNGQQLPHHNCSSSTVGTITSSMAKLIIASTGSDTVQPNTVNTGQLLPTASGSSGAVHGGSFNASNGML